MDRIFEYTNNKLSLRVDILHKAEVFRNIYDADQGSYFLEDGNKVKYDKGGELKKQAMRELSFIFAYASWNSPFYMSRSKKIRERKAVKFAGIADNLVVVGRRNWNYKELLPVCELVEEWQEAVSPTLAIRNQKIRAAKNEADLLAEYNNQIDKAQEEIRKTRGVNSKTVQGKLNEGVVDTLLLKISQYTKNISEVSKHFAQLRADIAAFERAVASEISGGELSFIGNDAVGLTESADYDLKKYL